MIEAWRSLTKSITWGKRRKRHYRHCEKWTLFCGWISSCGKAEDMKKRECQQPCCQLCKSLTIWKETDTHCRAKQNISERHRDGPKWKDFRVQLPIPPFWEALSPGSPKTWVRNWDYTFKIFFLPTLPTIICLLMISWVEMLGLAKCWMGCCFPSTSLFGSSLKSTITLCHNNKCFKDDISKSTFLPRISVLFNMNYQPISWWYVGVISIFKLRNLNYCLK